MRPRLKATLRKQMEKETEIQESKTLRRILLVFSMVACFSLGVVITRMVINYFGPDIRASAGFLRSRGFGEASIGAIGGVVGGIGMMVIFGLVAFLPLFTIFWFYGPKCRSCGKPLLGPGVGRTGKCRYCGAAIDPERDW